MGLYRNTYTFVFENMQCTETGSMWRNKGPYSALMSALKGFMFFFIFLVELCTDTKKFNDP